jgi:hypothetical protein
MKKKLMVAFVQNATGVMRNRVIEYAKAAYANPTTTQYKIFIANAVRDSRF